MRGNVFVPPSELILPVSQLDLEDEYSLNNHHLAFTRRQMSRLAITQTFRDLDRNQIVLPKDVHSDLHKVYGPPKLPSLYEVMDAIDDAFHAGEMLRYGSANNPTYQPITPELMSALGFEYNDAA
jgi:hypothetical protein